MAEIILRDYQMEMVTEASSAFKKRNKSILIQSPTGSGKTAMASWMVQQTLTKGGDTWFICHRVELLTGTSNTFNKYGMPHGYIAAGLPMDNRNNLMICSIDTLKNRLGVLRAPKLAIFDEAHHCGAEGWERVLKWLLDNGTYVIGLSATPERLDGIGLDEYFTYMVEGPQPSWLMEQGFLSQYRMFCPDQPEIKGKVTERKAAEAMKKQAKLLGNMIEHYRQTMAGMKFVGFAVNVASSKEYARQFTEAGIPCAHLDGGTPKDERARVIKAYANGELEGVFNVSLFTEGFDLSSIAQTDVTIDALIDAQPTESYALQKQKWGRVLRPGAGKVAIINDHAGNNLRHGYPDDPETWSLKGDKTAGDRIGSAGGKPPPFICPKCFNSIKRPLPDACPYCTTVIPESASIILPSPGELKEVERQQKQAERWAKLKEQDACKTLESLIALGVRRGYKSPTVWASNIFTARMMKNG